MRAEGDVRGLLDLDDEAALAQGVRASAADKVGLAHLDLDLVAEVLQGREVVAEVGLLPHLARHALLKAQKDVGGLGRVLPRADDVPALLLAVGAVPHLLGPGAGGVALQAVLRLRVQILDEHAQALAVFAHVRLTQDLLRVFGDGLKEELAPAVRQDDLAAAVVRRLGRRVAHARDGADPRLGAGVRVQRGGHAAQLIDLAAALAADVVGDERPGLMEDVHVLILRVFFCFFRGMRQKPSSAQARSQSARREESVG